MLKTSERKQIKEFAGQAQKLMLNPIWTNKKTVEHYTQVLRGIGLKGDDLQDGLDIFRKEIKHPRSI